MTQKKAKVKPVSRPFLRGKPLDSNSPRSVLLFLLMLVLLTVVYLFVASMLMIDLTFLRVALNALLLVGTWAVFRASGVSNGAIAVNQGEIMYRRQERNEAITGKERAACYHPLKGFLIGLLGSLPILLIALILAFTAKRQMTTAGALPSWMSSIAAEPEYSTALSAYTTMQPIGLTDIARVITRMELLPWVNLIGSGNADGLLVLERVSPLLVLFPALSYGFGYTQGVKERRRIHTDIEAGNQRRQKREAKARKQRAASTKELN